MTPKERAQTPAFKKAQAKYRKTDKRKAVLARYRRSKKGKEAAARYQKRIDPVKAFARGKIHELTRTGKLIRQPCVICGEPNTQAHHEDYTKPLDIIWLCNIHHIKHHSKS